jgi:hypothetical protein
VVYDFVVLERPAQPACHHKAMFEHIRLASGERPFVDWYRDLAVAVADASVTGNLSDWNVSLNCSGRCESLVMCLAKAFGVTTAVAAVDRAEFGLGAAFEWFVGLDVAGADPSQVVAVAPATRLDDMAARRDSAGLRRSSPAFGNVRLGVAVTAYPLVVHLAEPARVLDAFA